MFSTLKYSLHPSGFRQIEFSPFAFLSVKAADHFMPSQTLNYLHLKIISDPDGGLYECYPSMKKAKAFTGKHLEQIPIRVGPQ